MKDLTLDVIVRDYHPQFGNERRANLQQSKIINLMIRAAFLMVVVIPDLHATVIALLCAISNPCSSPLFAFISVAYWYPGVLLSLCTTF